MPSSDEPAPTPEEFEEFVATALKVDPKGLSGKHHHECPGVLVVRGPSAEGAECELGEGCAVRGVYGQALLDAHPKQTPAWIAEQDGT